MKKYLILLVKVIITLVLFYFVLLKINLQSLKSLVSHINPFWFLLSVMNSSLQVPLVGTRWLRIIQLICDKRFENKKDEIQAINAGATFLGQVLPSPASDVLKLYWLHKLGVSWAKATVSVFLDRFIALYVFIIIALIIIYVITLGQNLVDLSHWVIGLMLSLALFTGGIIFFRFEFIEKYFRWPSLHRFIRELIELRNILVSRGSIYLFSLCLSTHLMTILCFYLIGLSLQITLSVFDAAIFMVSMVLATLIPISIAGWGVREFVAIYLINVIPELNAEEATAISVIFGMMMFMGSLPPLAYWWKKLPFKILIIG